MKDRTPATFIRLVAQGADAQHIADTSVATWQAISVALSPIIGQRGVHGLYKRSLHLSRAAYPWLAAVCNQSSEPDELGPLKAALLLQNCAEAAAANDALLQTFNDLLTSLIGSSLAERLLQSVWDNFSSGAAVEDSPP